MRIWWITCLMFVSNTVLSAGIPPAELQVLKRVAREYRLNATETRLLISARIHENGPQGMEMGVGDGIPDHPARRFKDAPLRSLTCQAQWVAGTIKRRFNGDVLKYAHRHCPLDAHNWYVSVSKWMGRLERQGIK